MKEADDVVGVHLSELYSEMEYNKFGDCWDRNVFQHICLIPSFRPFSPEELRLGSYQRSTFGTNTT